MGKMYPKEPCPGCGGLSGIVPGLTWGGWFESMATFTYQTVTDLAGSLNNNFNLPAAGIGHCTNCEVEVMICPKCWALYPLVRGGHTCRCSCAFFAS